MLAWSRRPQALSTAVLGAAAVCHQNEGRGAGRAPGPGAATSSQPRVWGGGGACQAAVQNAPERLRGTPALTPSAPSPILETLPLPLHG